MSAPEEASACKVLVAYTVISAPDEASQDTSSAFRFFAFKSDPDEADRSAWRVVPAKVASAPPEMLTFPEAAPKPNKDIYEQPDWKFPEQLDQKFDVKPVFQKLQQQYALSVLRDSI